MESACSEVVIAFLVSFITTKKIITTAVLQSAFGHCYTPLSQQIQQPRDR